MRWGSEINTLAAIVIRLADEVIEHHPCETQKDLDAVARFKNWRDYITRIHPSLENDAYFPEEGGIDSWIG